MYWVGPENMHTHTTGFIFQICEGMGIPHTGIPSTHVHMYIIGGFIRLKFQKSTYKSKKDHLRGQKIVTPTVLFVLYGKLTQLLGCCTLENYIQF